MDAAPKPKEIVSRPSTSPVSKSIEYVPPMVSGSVRLRRARNVLPVGWALLPQALPAVSISGPGGPLTEEEETNSVSAGLPPKGKELVEKRSEERRVGKEGR